jgi:hypothetical protein
VLTTFFLCFLYLTEFRQINESLQCWKEFPAWSNDVQAELEGIQKEFRKKMEKEEIILLVNSVPGN